MNYNFGYSLRFCSYKQITLSEIFFRSLAYQVSLFDCARATKYKRHHFKNNHRYHKLWINVVRLAAAAEVCLFSLSHTIHIYVIRDLYLVVLNIGYQ